ncbi:aldolase [Aquibacillus halophilus]|uniref:Aldolase n=1 Tax=Aquibacillus halophilus TaxID=930132 RepID=A0A6A8DAD9_9BACI|nr:aldolase [Aquibacillus halophilus]MRH42713.1 aldolase [Aquibacillus halophilus]
MTVTDNKIIYKVFGLNVSSELYFPELPQISARDNLVDILISKSDLSFIWAELAVPNKYFVVKENVVLFQVPRVATFLIENGKEITFSPLEGVQEDQIRLYILGTCMGALLMQRNILPLHGSAIAIDGKAYTIVGDSGVGKSTLASAFLQKGYQLLSDDVIPVTLSNQNIPYVTPAYPQQKLWQESLNEFGMESSQLRPIIDRETKFAVPVPDQFAHEPMPLAGVIELVKTETEEIKIRPVLALERLHTLFVHTYRNFLIKRSGLMEWHFDTTTKIANKIDLFRLERPTSCFTANELTDVILTEIKKEEPNL